MILYDSVMEAQRQATIEMRDTKFLKEDGAAEAQDDAEQNGDMDLFKKRTRNT